VIGAWLAAARLCGAIAATWPEIPPQRACSAALAIEVERGAWSPALVAGIAYHESRFDAAQVNAALGACGPMQVIWSADRDRQDRRCVRVRRDAWAGYRAGVRKLDQAAIDCERLRAPGLDCVLRVYAAGPGWRSAGAGRAATEFRALAHELARHLTVEVSS
jgi:hypothetical protein